MLSKIHHDENKAQFFPFRRWVFYISIIRDVPKFHFLFFFQQIFLCSDFPWRMSGLHVSHLIFCHLIIYRKQISLSQCWKTILLIIKIELTFSEPNKHQMFWQLLTVFLNGQMAVHWEKQRDATETFEFWEGKFSLIKWILHSAKYMVEFSWCNFSYKNIPV